MVALTARHRPARRPAHPGPPPLRRFIAAAPLTWFTTAPGLFSKAQVLEPVSTASRRFLGLILVSFAQKLKKLGPLVG